MDRSKPWTAASRSWTRMVRALAYVYGHADVRDAQVAKGLTLDEARRITSNIAKLPSLLGKDG